MKWTSLNARTGFDELMNQRRNSTSEEERQQIDAKIIEKYEQVKCILFTDLSNFTKDIFELGPIEAVQKIRNFHDIFIPIVEEHNGKTLKLMGDSCMVMFENVTDALTTVQMSLKELEKYNKESTFACPIYLCSGIGYGPIVNIDDVEIFGQEVNLASKLGEDIAGAHEILITEKAWNQLVQVEGYTGSYRSEEMLPVKSYKFRYYSL